MIRVFHAIGQGGFYSEHFDGFTLVYDCGSDQNVELIEREIRNSFEENQTIDAVFISHLHDDHVNGLDYLLRYCKVKKVFLPLLDNNAKICLKVYFAMKNISPSPFTQHVLNLNDGASPNFRDTQVVFIPDVETDSEHEFSRESVSLDDIKGNELSWNKKIQLSARLDWVFIPFNFRSQSRSIDLQNKLSESNLSISDPVDLEKILQDPDNRKKLIEIYKSVPGSLNTNSMTLYSGPELQSRKPFLIRCAPYFNWYESWYLSGVMYFGDFEALGAQKWKHFIGFYKGYWDLVGTVQIPHHGSRYNYNPEINRRHSKISVISAGYSNRHNHPHTSTVRSILNDGGFPVMVTENAGSRLVCEVIGV